VYQIEYDYRTGSSFGSHNETDVLEFEWENIEIAAEALKRIHEHYKWYQYKEKGYNWLDEVPKPKWHKIKRESIHEDQEHNLINLPTDNGEEVQFWPPWCGYFETLYGAKIIIGGKDMSFEL